MRTFCSYPSFSFSRNQSLQVLSPNSAVACIGLLHLLLKVLIAVRHPPKNNSWYYILRMASQKLFYFILASPTSFINIQLLSLGRRARCLLLSGHRVCKIRNRFLIFEIELQNKRPIANSCTHGIRVPSISSNHEPRIWL